MRQSANWKLSSCLFQTVNWFFYKPKLRETEWVAEIIPLVAATYVGKPGALQNIITSDSCVSAPSVRSLLPNGFRNAQHVIHFPGSETSVRVNYPMVKYSSLWSKIDQRLRNLSVSLAHVKVGTFAGRLILPHSFLAPIFRSGHCTKWVEVPRTHLMHLFSSWNRSKLRYSYFLHSTLLFPHSYSIHEYFCHQCYCPLPSVCSSILTEHQKLS